LEAWLADLAAYPPRLVLLASSGHPELDAVVLAWMSDATYHPAATSN
jgi:hypothetical protein